MKYQYSSLSGFMLPCFIAGQALAILRRKPHVITRLKKANGLGHLFHVQHEITEVFSLVQKLSADTIFPSS